MDRKISYRLVADRECACGSEFSKQLISVTDPPDRREFVPEKFDEGINIQESKGISYTCPDCELEWAGLLDKIPSGYYLRLKNEKGGTQSQLVHDEKIAIEASEGERIIDLLLELSVSAKLLKYHRSKIEEVELHALRPTPRGEVVHFLAHLKAYFAESYSFQKTFKTIITEGLPEQKRANKLFEKFKDRTRVVRGLRIYTQKERNILPNIRWTPDSSYPVISVDTVRSMETEVTEEYPSGYYNGSEQYYGHLDAEDINLVEIIKEHYSQVEWFIEELIKATIGEDSEAHEDIKEWFQLKQRYHDNLP